MSCPHRCPLAVRYSLNSVNEARNQRSCSQASCGHPWCCCFWPFQFFLCAFCGIAETFRRCCAKRHERAVQGAHVKITKEFLLIKRPQAIHSYCLETPVHKIPLSAIEAVCSDAHWWSLRRKLPSRPFSGCRARTAAVRGRFLCSSCSTCCISAPASLPGQEACRTVALAYRAWPPHMLGSKQGVSPPKPQVRRFVALSKLELPPLGVQHHPIVGLAVGMGPASSLGLLPAAWLAAPESQGAGRQAAQDTPRVVSMSSIFEPSTPEPTDDLAPSPQMSLSSEVAAAAFAARAGREKSDAADSSTLPDPTSTHNVWCDLGARPGVAVGSYPVTLLDDDPESGRRPSAAGGGSSDPMHWPDLRIIEIEGLEHATAAHSLIKAASLLARYGQAIASSLCTAQHLLAVSFVQQPSQSDIQQALALDFARESSAERVQLDEAAIVDHSRQLSHILYPSVHAELLQHMCSHSPALGIAVSITDTSQTFHSSRSGRSSRAGSDPCKTTSPPHHATGASPSAGAAAAPGIPEPEAYPKLAPHKQAWGNFMPQISDSPASASPAPPHLQSALGSGHAASPPLQPQPHSSDTAKDCTVEAMQAHSRSLCDDSVQLEPATTGSSESEAKPRATGSSESEAKPPRHGQQRERGQAPAPRADPASPLQGGGAGSSCVHEE